MLDCKDENTMTGLFCEAVETRLHALVVGIEDMDEYKKANTELKKCLNEIKDMLPEDKKRLTMVLDDFFSNVLSVCENYYYKNGLLDAINLKSLINTNRNSINL